MRILLALLCLAPLSASAQSNVEHLIGRPYAGLPGGWAGVGGAVLQSSPDGETYLLSAFESIHDGGHLFTYARIDQMVDDRYPVSTVLAALAVPDVREGEIAVWSACTDLQERTAIVVATGLSYDDVHDNYVYGYPRQAWVLDRDEVRFVPVDPEVVRCHPESGP